MIKESKQLLAYYGVSCGDAKNNPVAVGQLENVTKKKQKKSSKDYKYSCCVCGRQYHNIKLHLKAHGFDEEEAKEQVTVLNYHFSLSCEVNHACKSTRTSII